MTPEERRVRAVYLFLECVQGVEQIAGRLVRSFPSPPMSVKLLLEKSVKRELGMLFRYWATRHIWALLDAEEVDAKELNLTLLRLFTEMFNLPRDGSGLRYAELSTAEEDVREISQRMTTALGLEHYPLLKALREEIIPWRESVAAYTRKALTAPLEELTPAVKAWLERSPASGSVVS